MCKKKKVLSKHSVDERILRIIRKIIRNDTGIHCTSSKWYNKKDVFQFWNIHTHLDIKEFMNRSSTEF